MSSYTVLIPISFSPNRDLVAGEVASDIPTKSVKWLIEQGIIEPVEGKGPKAPVEEPVEEPADAIVEEAP